MSRQQDSQRKTYYNDDSFTTVMPRIIDPNLAFTKESIIASKHVTMEKAPTSTVANANNVDVHSHTQGVIVDSKQPSGVTVAKPDIPESRGESFPWKKIFLITLGVLVIGLLVWVAYKYFYNTPNVSVSDLTGSNAINTIESPIGDLSVEPNSPHNPLQDLSKFIINDDNVSETSDASDVSDVSDTHTVISRSCDSSNLEVENLFSVIDIDTDGDFAGEEEQPSARVVAPIRDHVALDIASATREDGYYSLEYPKSDACDADDNLQSLEMFETESMSSVSSKASNMSKVSVSSRTSAASDGLDLFKKYVQAGGVVDHILPMTTAD
jgi:hypothetical protein